MINNSVKYLKKITILLTVFLLTKNHFLYAQDIIDLSPKKTNNTKSPSSSSLAIEKNNIINSKNNSNIDDKNQTENIVNKNELIKNNNSNGLKLEQKNNNQNSLDKSNPKIESLESSKNPKNIAEKNPASNKITKKLIEPIPSRQVINNGFADLVEELLPTVVNITSSQELKTANTFDENLIEEFPKTPLFDELRKHLEKQLRGPNEIKRKLSSIGSGFIISKDGLIVTNHHVIDNAVEINVNLNDGSKYKAKIIGVDKKTDIALLKINPTKDLKFANFGDSSTARIGEWVIVIGNPYGLGGSVSIGIVSARGRDINNGQSDEFIQTDAAINKGNSGGPMFNAKGEVIGISTAIFSPSGGSVGIGFATPSANAIQVVKQLREQGEVTRGWIGVSVQDISEEIAESMKLENTKGAFVVDVIQDSPADKAGILPTDIILKFEDQEIEDMKFLPKTVAKYPVGKTANIQIFRQGKIKNLKIKIEKLKENETKKIDKKNIENKPIVKGSSPILGLSLAEFKSKIRKDQKEIIIEGLLIVDVINKSEAFEKGINIGDIILSANQIPTKNLEDLKEIIEEANKGNKKLFLFIRRNEISYPAVINLK